MNIKIEDKRVIDAIKNSITHWRNMQKDPNCGEEPYDVDCPLCQMFDGSENCRTTLNGVCPIARKTGWTQCRNTPYQRAADMWEDAVYAMQRPDLHKRAQIKEIVNQWKQAAKEEITFLQSLLK